jgi:hypothetical protein
MFVKFADCAKIIKAAYPDYRGKGDVSVNSSGRFDCTERYWSEGCRNYYVIVRLADCMVAKIPGVNPLHDTADQYDCAIPAGYAVVCRKFRGTRELMEISVSSENVAQFLPAPQAELTENQAKCLEATRSYKSSYAGISNYRQHASGLSESAWAEAKAQLIQMGLLAKNGAVTTAGKNVPRYRPVTTPMIGNSAE